MKRIVLALAALLACAVPSAALAASTTPPMFTLMMGRGIEAQALDTKCATLAAGPSLADTAAFLQGYGLKATVNATLSLTSDDATAPVCTGRLLYPTWDQLRALRDTYGWDVIPRGATSGVITGLSGQALYDNTCGVLPKFQSEGFPDAWGMYAYPQNRFTKADQQVVETCYGFGRRYSGLGAGASNSMMVPDPFFAKALSVNGGLCNDTTQPCYTDPLVRNQRRYMTPAQLDASVATGLGRWTTVQFYRLITGAQGTSKTPAGTPAWDCTSADPAEHWSHLPEEYCYQDFQAFIAGLPAGVTDASPADVARLYGRDFTPVTP